MRVDKLTLTNFRCHAHLEIDVDPAVKTVVVAGFNDRGKSTINDALAFLCAGRCRGVGGGGQGMANLQRNGTKDSFGVEAKTSAGILRRGLQGPRSPIQTTISKAIGTSPERALACLYGAEFLDLHADKQQAMLQEILGVSMDSGLLGDSLSGEACVLVERYLNIQEGTKITLEDFATAEASLREDRRVAKRILKDSSYEAPAPPEGIPGQPTSEEATEIMGTLDVKLEGLQEEINKVQAVVDKAGGSLEELERQQTDLKVAQLENHKVPVFKAAERDEALAVIVKPAEKARDAVEDARKEAHNAAQAVDTYTKEKAEASLQVENCIVAPAAGTRCSMCRRVHTNSTVEAAVKAHEGMKTDEERAVLLEHEQRKGDVLTLSQGRLKEQGQVLETAKGLLIVAEKTMTTAESEILKNYKDSQESEKEHTKIMHALGGLVKRIDHARNTEHEQRQLKELKRRLELGRVKVKTLQGYITQREDHEVQVNAHTEASKAVAVMDELIDAFKPSGLPGKMLGEVVDPFMDAVQEVMHRFGYSVKLSFSPFEMVVNGVSMELVATSVRLRVGLAFQAAIAKWSGFKMIAVDNVDWLDKQGRASLMEVLENVPELDQVWLFQTLKGEDLPEPSVSGDTQLVILAGA